MKKILSVKLIRDRLMRSQRIRGCGVGGLAAMKWPQSAAPLVEGL
jgi:hypothetical protein